MTPNDIEILLHHYVCPGDPHPRLHAPAVRESIRDFVADGILEQQDQSYATTTKGRALIAMLCRTELPQQAWVDKDNNVILKAE